LAAALAAEEAAARGRGPGASRAARRAEAIRSSIASLEAETRGRADGEIALRQLDREAEALAALHEGFLSRLKETRAQTGLERPDARLIAEAAAPLEPSRPNARIAMALALTAGLGLGAAAALLRESVAGVHHSTEAAERDAGLPVLAALPRPERRGEDPVAAARRRPSSRLAEAVRDLRARALPPAFLSARAAPTPRDSVALAVVSPGPGEGKSTLAALLAESCARLGRRTVLLDGDLRAPSHAERLGLAAETDIGALLEGSAELDEVLWLDPETGVSILPAMPSDAPRADLLADAGAGPLIAALKARFDVVIVDTPPLLAVADGRLLAAEADRCIVALRWGETEREALRAALRALAEAGARPLGLALTATPRRADPRPGRRGANARYERFGAYFEE
ncbi:MAG: GNVR domain-containing protein, partial [Pseudomonadota bacterium]